MAGHKYAVCIATEHSGVLIHPCNGTPNLIGHWHKTASRVLHVNEIDNYRVRSCTDKYFGWKSIVDRPAKPGANMDENVDRCVWTVRRINVESLDRRRSILVAARLPQPLAHREA